MSKRTTEFAATITGDANSALAALERVRARVKATGEAAQSANLKVADSTEVLVKNSEKAAKGVAAITQSLYAMEAEGSAKVLALGGAVGNFADLLGPGGKVVSGIAIVSSAIVSLFLQAKEKAREARESIEKDIASLVNAGDFEAITKRIREIELGTAAGEFKDGRAGIRERIRLLEDEIEAEQRSNRFYLASQDKRQKALAAEKSRLQELNEEYDRFYAALTNPNNVAAAARGLAGQPIITAADDPNKKQKKTEIADLIEEAKALNDATRKAAEGGLRLLTDSIDQLNEATRRRLTLADDLNNLDSGRAREISALREELAAVQAGTEAYREFREERERQAFIDAEVAKEEARLLLEGKELTADKKLEIRAAAQFAFDLRLQIGEAAAALANLGAGSLVEQMASVAQSATAIATSLGEAGRNIAVVAGIGSTLFQGINSLQSGLQKRDGAGNIIKGQTASFADALRGRNGKDSQAAALAGTLSIVGTVAQVADALDVFGTRAREQARIIRERAIAFNAALEAFSLQQGTELEQRLRQNLRQAEQVAAARGVDGVEFTSSDDIRAIAERFRNAAAAAERLGKSSLGSAKELLAAAAALDELAETAAANEEIIRQQNQSALARLNEDLNLRRIALSQGRDAAEQARIALELQRQENEARERFGPAAEAYITALREITAAEIAAAAETQRRANILRQLSDDNTFLGGDTETQLRRGFKAFGDTFSEFAGIFDDFDLSTREGLESAKAKIRELYTAIAADGVTEAEQPIIDFLRTLLGDIDGAISGLPDVLDPVAAALEAFEERVSLFGLSIADQLDELGKIFEGKFGETFDNLLAGADLGTAEGRQAFKDAIGAQLEAILADGVIDESERELYNVLRQLFGLAVEAIEDGEADAEAAIAAAAQNRQRNRTRSQERIDLFGLTGADALEENLRGLGGVFADFASSFDVTTIAGIEAAQEQLRGLYREIEGLSDEEIFERFGMTREELVAGILATNSSLTTLASTLGDVAAQTLEAARAAKEFTDSLEQDFLRATGQGREAEIKAAEDRRDNRIKQAQQLGLGAGALAQIEAIFNSDVDEINRRFAPQAADVGSGAGAVGDAAGRTSGGRRPGNTSIVSDFGGLSEITAQSLAGLLREIAVNTGRDGALVRAILGGTLQPLSNLSFPAFPSAAAGAGVVIGSITITIGALSPGGLTPTEAAREATEQITRELGRIAVGEARFLGSGVRS